MHTSNAKHIALFLLTALAVAIGCSDANATEATYLPVDTPCPETASTDAEKPVLLDLEPPATDTEYLDDAEHPDEERLDDDRRDTEELFETSPWSQAVPHVGPTPQLLPASHPGDAPEAPGDAARDEAIDINSADADELTELTGIGPALAERIVEYRRQRDFDDPAQLQRIDGIGPSTYEDVAADIRVE